MKPFLCVWDLAMVELCVVNNDVVKRSVGPFELVTHPTTVELRQSAASLYNALCKSAGGDAPPKSSMPQHSTPWGGSARIPHMLCSQADTSANSVSESGMPVRWCVEPQHW